ncbi:HXXEE domain-containing protein [Cellulomonas sp. PhB150]|uniref:HXXEE domain-containing protein n=1 Tax=Cellulomonas sp. PhB150 TaxID=2485188 RepID=UPI000F495435|nr:HXXEE domain-containing protein [Cellulomonas sp. PhB150]ROS26278.1 uncharacterized protein with HXXEE motif [Cellulomonas sp. PhB150]
MSYFRRRWYDVGAVLGVGIAIWALVGDWSTLQLILLWNFVAFMVHQFEEYHWPGGEAWITNEVVQPRGGPVDRYPLNQNNAAFINVIAWPFYIIGAFFPDQIWLGIGTVLFGFGQIVVHGIITNIRLKTIYNPGMFAVIVGHTPLGIWYLIEIYDQDVVSGWDWLFGVLYTAFFIGVIMLRIGYTALVSKTSPYPFEPAEMQRWNRAGRLARIGVTPGPVPSPVANEPDLTR